ncbi:uncharacterized protein [Lolium perenne]|uniref:uncharacterized protein n=1 Tax=Lolium perenne TaxID=4522 RepID=UPI003A9A5405
MTSAAEEELSVALRLAHNVTLRDGPDLRCMDSSSAPRFCTRQAYRLLSSKHPLDSSSSISWALRLPSKVKLFAYLADIDHLSSRANLFTKSCASSAGCTAYPSTARHLFFDCPVSARIWRRLDVPILAGLFSVWDLPAPFPLTLDIWRAGVVVTLWSIWKARNDLVFNAKSSTSTLVHRRACDDLSLWRWWYRVADRPMIDLLRSFILSRLWDS